MSLYSLIKIIATSFRSRDGIERTRAIGEEMTEAEVSFHSFVFWLAYSFCLSAYIPFSSQTFFVPFFRANLAIVKELGDRGAQGRACGNLGNTHYLLGNFELAIMFHEEVGLLLQLNLSTTAILGQN